MEKEEGSVRSKASLRKVWSFLSTNQCSSLPCLHQEMKLRLGLPHLWFLLGSLRAVRHHPDPLGLLPPLKVLWHLKNNAAFT